MRILEAKADVFGWIHLRVDPEKAFYFVKAFKPEKEYQITEVKEKRSKNANAYAWTLITKIAQRIRKSPVEVYREQLAEISGIYEFLWMEERAVEAFEAAFTEGHIGRLVNVVSVDEKGLAYVMVTYGSSDFDKYHMQILLDNIIQDCEALEIETKDEKYIKSLLEAYDGKK